MAKTLVKGLAHPCVKLASPVGQAFWASYEQADVPCTNVLEPRNLRVLALLPVMSLAPFTGLLSCMPTAWTATDRQVPTTKIADIP